MLLGAKKNFCKGQEDAFYSNWTQDISRSIFIWFLDFRKLRREPYDLIASQASGRRRKRRHLWGNFNKSRVLLCVLSSFHLFPLFCILMVLSVPSSCFPSTEFETIHVFFEFLSFLLSTFLFFSKLALFPKTSFPFHFPHRTPYLPSLKEFMAHSRCSFAACNCLDAENKVQMSQKAEKAILSRLTSSIHSWLLPPWMEQTR